MFSLNNYISFTGFENDHVVNCESFPCTNETLALFWTPILHPSIPLEKLYPLVLNELQTNVIIHEKITNDVKYQHFVSVYQLLINNLLLYIRRVNQMPETVFLNSFNCSLNHSIQKPQRFVSFNFVKYKTAIHNLNSNDLFVYASRLVDFHEKRNGISILIFTNVLRVQLLQSLISFAESTPAFTKNDFLILPYSVNAKQRQNLLVLDTSIVSSIQHFIFCDWVCDSASSRKNSLLISPFIVSQFDKTDLTIFSTIKTLLRWFCVSRSQYRGLIRPGEPGFAMYKYLPLFLSCFSIRRELSKYHTRKFVSTTSKKIDNSVPNFLRGLKSFLQLKNEHFINFQSIETIYNLLHSRKYLQSLFPQVWDITNFIMFKQKRKSKVSLNDTFLINKEQIPSYMFIYAMMLHKSVPKKIKQMIWLNIYTTSFIVLPCKLKGIEQLQRHKMLYKSYDKFVEYKCDNEINTNNEFLQLMLCLEYRSYMNPSKISFKVSKIPSIKLINKGVNYPIFAKDKLKTNQEIERCNYVYSNQAWVVRGIDKPSCFDFKRTFLFDELLYLKLLKTI